MHRGFKVSAIVTSSGKATRFGSNKLLQEIDGSTVLERTVRTIIAPEIDELIVTVSPDNEPLYREILVEKGGIDARIVLGDRERFLSARNGLRATTGDIVLVHDGVRPFVSHRMITQVLDAAIDHGAAMLGLPSTVQIKLVSEDGFVKDSLDRSASWYGQTPQAFRRELLEEAYEKAIADEYFIVSDDADLVARYAGCPPRILQGHEFNIKITTPLDMIIARDIARQLTERGPDASF
ncbi:2-C-methyl-D-erythritol 4-phosphate cytidylyltransferase [Naasia sp. SYSU D00948]|uniref:IspD/TarI family cytidylyltransferase n=1 Tax=Naasia sp. SYSU D00948 TaxID=2817379 RepID=UPI001B304F46|nr:IspD/TarI family cytidylyltransferase [Naasia sp. SYSU D00948]